MGDLPFKVYFDFGTTTGDGVIDDKKKMYISSYCKVYDFHPGLNIPKISVFRSFQQDFEEITSLDHFIQEHVSFFDQVTMVQMKDEWGRDEWGRDEWGISIEVALAELFTLELKFTIYTLIKWFNATLKPKFLELNNFQKQAFVEENAQIFLKRPVAFVVSSFAFLCMRVTNEN